MSFIERQRERAPALIDDDSSIDVEVGKNILIVEDDPYWQKILSTTIRRIEPHVSVKFASDVVQAEKCVYMSHGAYDLIVVDHFLQGNNTGIEFFKSMQDGRFNLPFLFVSGLTRDEFWQELDYPHVPDFFSKSDNFLELKKVLARKLGHAQYTKDNVPPYFGHFKAGILILAMLATSLLLLVNGYRSNYSQKLMHTNQEYFIEPAVARMDTRQQIRVAKSGQIVTPQIKKMVSVILERASTINGGKQ